MFQSSRKTMKWSSLLKDIKEKVGLSPSPSPSGLSSISSAVPAADAGGGAESALQGRNGSLADTQSPARFSLSLSLPLSSNHMRLYALRFSFCTLMLRPSCDLVHFKMHLTF